MIPLIRCASASVLFRLFFFFSSRRRHTRYIGDWSSDVCSSELRAHARLQPDGREALLRNRRWPAAEPVAGMGARCGAPQGDPRRESGAALRLHLMRDYWLSKLFFDLQQPALAAEFRADRDAVLA